MTTDDDRSLIESTLYDRLLADMTNGQFHNGTPLRVQNLAQKYGSSANPVREVLRRMEGEGLVEFKKNKGATVATLNRQQVVNIFELIRLIEPYLAAGFAKVCTPEQVDELTRIQDDIREISQMDRVGFGEKDMLFHQLIAQGHYNQAAFRTWMSQRRLLNTLTRRKVLTNGRHKAVLAEHDLLIEAFRANDVERATDVITTHIDGAGQALSAHLDSDMA
ncbi:MAG: GntR family transcriptional regulator [Marinosulfonomonas sp.]